MANKLAYVTGDKAVDLVLSKFEPKFQKIYGRKAARLAGKKVQKDAIAAAPKKTGALRKSIKLRAAKRSRKIAFGMRIYIDSTDLFLNLIQKGGITRTDKKRGGAFFYPSVVEFGDKDTPAQKPLRKALFGNEQAINSFFRAELSKQIRATTPLTK